MLSKETRTDLRKKRDILHLDHQTCFLTKIASAVWSSLQEHLLGMLHRRYQYSFRPKLAPEVWGHYFAAYKCVYQEAKCSSYFAQGRLLPNTA